MTANNDSAHGSSHGSNKGLYITIFLILGFLTAIEVFVPDVYAGSERQTSKMLLLVILAVAKAMLVGIYFMHLKWEKPWLKWIALMPVYMGLFTIFLMLETVYR